MENAEERDKKINKPILEIFYNTFVSSKLQKKLRAIIPIVCKWIIGFFLGIVIGFLLCYLYLIHSEQKEFDWKIITGLFATLGAIITAVLVNMTNFMRLVVDKGRYHLQEMEFEAKRLDHDRISDNLAKELLPLINEKLFQSNTIYEFRAKHYSEEKECIAKQYIKLLGERINSLLNSSDITDRKDINNIVVILDSGTTISQIFNHLGKESYSKENYWSKNPKIQFFTNSIRGVLHLFKYRKHDSRYSKIPFPCSIFSGKILSPYEAIADITTIQSILQFKKNDEFIKKNNYIIFVTTGNYLIANTNSNIVAPIARAGFHHFIKAAGYYVANEVHLVAPLGKVLINSPAEINKEDIHKTLERFNSALGYTINPSDDSKEKYSLIEPKLLLDEAVNNLLSEEDREQIKKLTVNSWSSKSVLITTRRITSAGKRYKFHNHSAVLERHLTNNFNPKTSSFQPLRTAYIKSFDFNGLPTDPELQVKHEVPHDNLRNKEKLHMFFELEERSEVN